jgi:catechol 2,3-dioxygenase-like lactoylglutathione lyase family enzyme
MKIAPILIVDEIEPSLSFWTERLGFSKTVEIPEGDRLGFVILVRGEAEVMLQTVESARKDTGDFVPETTGNNSALFIEIPDFPDVLDRLIGYPVALADRTTFYGMREIGVHAPSGHPVIFAARVAG